MEPKRYIFLYEITLIPWKVDAFLEKKRKLETASSPKKKPSICSMFPDKDEEKNVHIT